MDIEVTPTVFLTTGDIESLFEQATGVGLCSWGSWNCPDNAVNVSPDAETCSNGGQFFIGHVSDPTDAFDDYDPDNDCGYIRPKEKVMEEIAGWQKGKDTKTIVTYQWAICFLATYTDLLPKVESYIFES